MNKPYVIAPAPGYRLALIISSHAVHKLWNLMPFFVHLLIVVRLFARIHYLASLPWIECDKGNAVAAATAAVIVRLQNDAPAGDWWPPTLPLLFTYVYENVKCVDRISYLKKNINRLLSLLTSTRCGCCAARAKHLSNIFILSYFYVFNGKQRAYAMVLFADYDTPFAVRVILWMYEYENSFNKDKSIPSSFVSFLQEREF